MRILVLDDSSSRHELFKIWLKGHTIVEAYTAKAAIEALGGQTFDVVFLDHDLGPEVGNDGATVAGHIAKMTNKPNLVVIHSANTPAATAMEMTLRLFGTNVVRYDFTRMFDHRPYWFPGPAVLPS